MASLNSNDSDPEVSLTVQVHEIKPNVIRQAIEKELPAIPQDEHPILSRAVELETVGGIVSASQSLGVVMGVLEKFVKAGDQLAQVTPPSF